MRCNVYNKNYTNLNYYYLTQTLIKQMFNFPLSTSSQELNNVFILFAVHGNIVLFTVTGI